MFFVMGLVFLTMTVLGLREARAGVHRLFRDLDNEQAQAQENEDVNETA